MSVTGMVDSIVSPIQYSEAEQRIDLHTLCENCRDFFGHWKVLLQTVVSQEECSQGLPYSVYLSSIAHFQHSRHACHACNFLQGSLDRWPFIKKHDPQHNNVYLHVEEEAEGSWVVHALFDNAQPMSKGD